MGGRRSFRESRCFSGAARQPGPFTLITAGIHGDEYEGPAAVAAFVETLSSSSGLAGSVAAIPVANPMAWRASQRTSPDDGLNLARTFPGRADGSPTERLAAALFELAIEADYLIDLHSGGVEYLFFPMTGFYGVAELSNPSLCRCAAVSDSRRCGRCRPRRACSRVNFGSADAVSSGASIWAQDNCLRRAATRMFAGFFRVWRIGRICRMNTFCPRMAGHAPAIGNWPPPRACLWRHCAIGETVAPGQLLAEIRDPRGRCCNRSMLRPPAALSSPFVPKPIFDPITGES